MPNQDAAYGFRAVSLHGTDPQFNVNASQGYTVASGYGTSLYYGDPVKLGGDADAKGRPEIIIAPAGAVRGVFAGCEYTNAQGERIFSKHWPSGTVATDVIAHVFDHAETIFSIQADGDLATTDIGNKVDFVSGSGSAQTGFSAYELDSSDIGTGDALLIIGLDNTQIPNDFGANAKALVKFREHELGAALTAV